MIKNSFQTKLLKNSLKHMENKKNNFLIGLFLGVLVSLPITGGIVFFIGLMGIGLGSAITSTTDGGQGNIASQQQLDMAVPDPEFCRQWGASAFVIDVEMYTTLNPSTSFVTQPSLQPGCVTKLVDGFRVVYISTSITKALAPHCLQNSGSGTAISNCC